VNGTGGCSQSFAILKAGSPTVLKLAFLDSLIGVSRTPSATAFTWTFGLSAARSLCTLERTRTAARREPANSRCD